MSEEIRIEVSLDALLVRSIERLAETEGKSRSILIGDACLAYLKEKHPDGSLDDVYAAGYGALPEEALAGEIQVAVLSNVLAEESW